jgi:VIT1/CCC1 family predicted Fe2+/Mn2+ transporter
MVAVRLELRTVTNERARSRESAPARNESEGAAMQRKPPTFIGELGQVFGTAAIAIGIGVIVIILVYYLADAPRHPIRAIWILCGILLVGQGVYIAWSGYKWKRKAWESDQDFKAKMERHEGGSH